jgi:hypothetical protein
MPTASPSKWKSKACRRRKKKVKKNNTFLMIAVPLAIALLGLTLYEYGYLGVQSEVTATQEASIEKKRMLKKYLTLIASKPSLEKQIASLKETRKTEGSKTIEGQTPSVAAAALQNTLKNMIALRGGTISSERIEKPEELGNFQIITVAVDAVLPDIRALSDTLFAIETQTPYLVVRDLDVTIRNFQAPKELLVRLKLSGLTGGK